MSTPVQFITTDDLKANALWLGGEPTDGSSTYDNQVMSWMQLVYDTLVNGGTLGMRDIATSAGLYEHVVDIPVTDWMWLRKFPPYSFNTVPAILGAATSVSQSTPTPTTIGTATLTNLSTIVTFSIAPPVSVANWRLNVLNQEQGITNPPITVPRIVEHFAGSLTATLDAPWPQETQTVSNYILVQLEYQLPPDFLRFTESPYVHGGWTNGTWGAGGQNPRLAIGTAEQVEDYFPLQNMDQGPPSAAARIHTDVIQMNRWDTQSFRIEFSYVSQPPQLQTGIAQQPVVPLRFRHVLSIGAAMMIAQDKVDGRMTNLSSEFREIVAHMGQEYRKEQIAGSELMGKQLYRRNQGRRGLLRTSSGLPLW